MLHLRKAIKPHDCVLCANPIAKGEQYYSERTRGPRFDADDNQVGIEYVHSCWHAENCQAGDSDYFYLDICAEEHEIHEWTWRGPSQTSRYCERCMRLESQLYPEMHSWALVPTGVKSWQHPKMSKAEIRALRFNMMVQEISAMIRRRNYAASRIEAETTFTAAHQYHTNIDMQWMLNSMMINIESLQKLEIQLAKDLDLAIKQLLQFFRSLHEEHFVELEYKFREDFSGQVKIITLQ